MAEINDVQLVDFCNNNLRPTADKLAHLQSILESLVAMYNARNLGTIITNAGSSNLITDGSQSDGRTRTSGGDVFNLITLIQDLQAFMTQGRKDVIAKWQVNGVK